MSTRPTTLIAAAAIEALEGAAMLGVGLFVGIEAIVGRPLDLASAVALAVISVGGGIGMLAVAWALCRMRRWGRAPAAVTQIFALPVSWSMIQSEQYAVGIPMVVAAVAALALLLSRPSGDALLDR